MLEVVLRYYVQTTQTLDENDIHDLITHVATEEDSMPTFIDRYIEQGRQQGLFLGRQEGRQQGLQKGMQKGQQEILLRLITRKFGAPTPAQRRRIAKADGEALLRWSEQLLFATTAEEAPR